MTSPVLEGLKCPNCGNLQLDTLDSRKRGHGIKRRKKCIGCGKRFNTREFLEQSFPKDVLRTLDPRDVLWCEE